MKAEARHREAGDSFDAYWERRGCKTGTSTWKEAKSAWDACSDSAARVTADIAIHFQRLLTAAEEKCADSEARGERRGVERAADVVRKEAEEARAIMEDVRGNKLEWAHWRNQANDLKELWLKIRALLPSVGAEEPQEACGEDENDLRRLVSAPPGWVHEGRPRWSCVGAALSRGSGHSIALCRRFGFDPNEESPPEPPQGEGGSDG